MGGGSGRMSNFEKRFGKYAIKNISLILLLCYGAGYIIEAINESFLLYLTLDPYAVLHGEVWRLFTWILIPPSSGNIFLTVIMLYFYCSIGTTLERTWGTYRYNVYLFQGMLFTIAGSFLLMGYRYLFNGAQLAGGAAPYFQYASLYFSTYYINMSIFLAFAATFPEVQVLLMFIIPVKVKWMGVAPFLSLFHVLRVESSGGERYQKRYQCEDAERHFHFCLVEKAYVNPKMRISLSIRCRHRLTEASEEVS